MFIQDELESLSIRYSTNLDIVKYINENYSEYKKIIQSFVLKSEISIRVNTLKITKLELKKLLENMGFEVGESQISNDSLIVKNPNKLPEIKEFKEGLFTIQDQASCLVSEVLDPKEGSKILDICAAPGSKSTHIGQLTKNKARIISNDISNDKLPKIKENFDRLGVINYEITNYDATILVKDWIDSFDYILVDAPCSGLGVIKRKPEIKLNRSLEDIISLSKIQKKILENSFNYLKKGGVLVYSTCTFGPIENQDIINKFLMENPNAKLQKLDEKDFLEFLPNEQHDGFFIAKIQKYV